MPRISEILIIRRSASASVVKIRGARSLIDNGGRHHATQGLGPNGAGDPDVSLGV